MAEAGLWLTPSEVAELTEYKRRREQCRALADMGVPFKPNRVGRPLVDRALYAVRQGKRRAKVEPDWSGIGGPTTQD